MKLRKFPHYVQLESGDCGPACLRIVAKYYGKEVSSFQVKKLCFQSRNGANLLAISKAAELLGFKTLGASLSFQEFKKNGVLPCIVYWKKQHFFVVYKVTKKHIYISDPGAETHPVKLSIIDFKNGWKDDEDEKGVALFLNPSISFFKDENIDESEPERKNKLRVYFNKYRRLFFQLLFAVLGGVLFQLLFPFLTQWLVDIGIKNNDLNFLYIILFAQLAVFAGKTITDAIKGWLLLHLGTRINVSLLSDYFFHILRLPLSFFERKSKGDIYQRVNDHSRIEEFMTSQSINVVFSFFTLVVFLGVLASYNFIIFLTFLVGTFIYLIWIYRFMSLRQKVDYRRFSLMTNNQSNLFEMIDGVQEIKLNNFQDQKRWEWEGVQAKIFKNSVRGLKIEQLQIIGATFINELKNIIVTFYSAILVYEGRISLGEMLSIQFIIGQLNSPLYFVLNFINSFQDTKLALERLSEIDFETPENLTPTTASSINDLSNLGDIKVKNLSFSYGSPDIESNVVFRNLSFSVPFRKTTAIVGPSGCGKSTLLKLLLGLYTPLDGKILIHNIPLNNINHYIWRDKCSVVMQDGYIFNGTIAYNISMGYHKVDDPNVYKAAGLAQILEEILDLPMGFNTKIGMDGKNLSEGQKQRILLARAIFKDSPYIFLDEATSSLDSSNENSIIKNMDKWCCDKTVIVVAHRLSTIRQADNILVLNKNGIVEQGDYESLIDSKKMFHALIQNQLS